MNKTALTTVPAPLYLATNLAMLGAAMPIPDGDAGRTLREVAVLLADQDCDAAFEIALQAIERSDATPERDPGIFVLAGVVSLLSSNRK